MEISSAQALAGENGVAQIGRLLVQQQKAVLSNSIDLRALSLVDQFEKDNADLTPRLVDPKVITAASELADLFSQTGADYGGNRTVSPM